MFCIKGVCGIRGANQRMAERRCRSSGINWERDLCIEDIAVICKEDASLVAEWHEEWEWKKSGESETAMSFSLN